MLALCLSVFHQQCQERGVGTKGGKLQRHQNVRLLFVKNYIIHVIIHGFDIDIVYEDRTEENADDSTQQTPTDILESMCTWLV